jgi:hypothetical protein
VHARVLLLVVPLVLLLVGFKEMSREKGLVPTMLPMDLGCGCV